MRSRWHAMKPWKDQKWSCGRQLWKMKWRRCKRMARGSWQNYRRYTRRFAANGSSRERWKHDKVQSQSSRTRIHPKVRNRLWRSLCSGSSSGVFPFFAADGCQSTGNCREVYLKEELEKSIFGRPPLGYMDENRDAVCSLQKIPIWTEAGWACLVK